MKFNDMAGMGFANLWRTRLRSALTVLGVMIGIGTLTSMVSFGTGMQKNISDVFYKNDLFTSMSITPKKMNLEVMAQGNPGDLGKLFDEKTEPLTDSILMAIRKIDGVEIAFPDETFPGKMSIGDKESKGSIRALPSSMADYYPFNSLLAGTFFENDSTNRIVVSWEALRKAGFIADYPGMEYELSREDSLKNVAVIDADSLVGRTIKLTTASVNSDLARNPLGLLTGRKLEPFREVVSDYIIGGILAPRSEFGFNHLRADVYVPARTAEKIPRLSFNSVWDILDPDRKEGTYASIYVRVAKIEEMGAVRKQIEKMGVGVFSISDQLKEIRANFLIMDGLLGAIGTIALVIAALGIINTMLMSILERTREIGIMKAVGGSEGGIRMIFFTEASFIGVIGALFGLLLGWGVTRIANTIMNAKIQDLVEGIDLFYFPLWLIFGAIAFSVLISMAAGLYPAMRAARIDPVRALRHD